MLDILAKIYDDGGRLVGVSQTLFEGNPRFVSAFGLRFESVSAIFRAVPDDDTLAVGLGPLVPDPDETLVDADRSSPWTACIGFSLCWAWRLTNQQGYSDGVRLEFSEPGKESGVLSSWLSPPRKSKSLWQRQARHNKALQLTAR